MENGEGNRVLLITSWRRHGIVGPDRGGTYQYFDQPAVIRPMAKWSGAVPSFERIPELLNRAFRISWRGRPGVVHLTVPEDIINGEYDEPGLRRSRARIAPAVLTPIEPAADLVLAAADLLVGAERSGDPRREWRAARACDRASWPGWPSCWQRTGDDQLGGARRHRRAP